MDMNKAIEEYVSKGFKLTYQDKQRYASLYKNVDVENVKVEGSDRVISGETMEITQEKITQHNSYKCGWLWASSAEIVSRKGNVYLSGKSEIVETFSS